MTKRTIEDLQGEIEKLVRDHLAAQRSAATAAVERAFASATAAPSNTRATRRTSGRRRPPSEVAGLAEQLYAAIRANPGELMIVFARQLSQPARALNRPMLQLKRAGRVRSAGQRHITRYFPMITSKAA